VGVWKRSENYLRNRNLGNPAVHHILRSALTTPTTLWTHIGSRDSPHNLAIEKTLRTDIQGFQTCRTHCSSIKVTNTGDGAA
jgi:hypothetical protein